MGGLYTEATPESLPLGASPRVINCDFQLGSVYQRAGKHSFFYFSGFFEEHNAGHGQSVADSGSSGEAAWINPSNITLDVPGTEATVTLNFSGSGGPAYSFDHDFVQSTGTNVTTFSVGPVTPTLPFEWALFSQAHGNSLAMDASWTDINTASGGAIFGKLVPSGSVSADGTFGAGGSSYCGIVSLFYTLANAAPTIQNGNNQASGFTFTIQPRTISSSWSSGNTAGNCIIVVLTLLGQTGGTTSIVDDLGNTYTKVSDGTQGSSRQVQVWIAEGIAGGANQVHVTNDQGFASSGDIFFMEFSPLGNPTVTGPTSQELQGLNYAFAIPATQGVLGFQVEVSGFQSDSTATSGIEVSVANPAVVGGPRFFAQLPSTDGTVTVATPLENWNLTLTNGLVNDPNFTVQVQAVAPDGLLTTFNVYAVKVKLWLTPNPAPNFNYLKTFSETGGEVLNLALGSDGVIYQEDAINAPGVLESVFLGIEPDSFAQSVTFDDREFMAFSNLRNGTDIPRTYTPPYFDRLTQVGPGAAPSASTTAAGSTVSTITQNPKVLIPTSSGGTSGSYIVWSDSPSDRGNFGTPATPGNEMLWVFPHSYVMPSYIKVGVNIVISGVQTMNGYNPNNGAGTNPPYYTVTSVGAPIAGQDYYNGFAITLPQTGFYNLRFQAGSAFQLTIATMKTTVQIPNLEVGNQFQLSGTGGAPPAGYDSTWTVLTTPNAAQLQITSTVLNGNVATYGYNLLTGTNPVVGEYVTVTQTLNGNGVFNVANAVITAASAGSFSVNLVGANISSVAETGSGIIFGTIFTFDAFAIVGNKSGGSIVTVGVIAAGIRKACYSFLTRNGYVTAPSPILQTSIVAGASGLAISNLAIGPPNVIARIIHLTAANGGNFYNIPQSVTVVDNGVSVVNTSTWVNDNSTTNVVLSFSDGVLLASDEIDIEGNNLFENIELGSCVALVPYAQRLFAVGEQNKVFNFVNWSFDGGIGVVQGNAAGGGGLGGNTTYPLGWTVDPTNGSGGSVVTSSIFGTAYQIQNLSGVTKAAYGMIAQNAYLDEFMVPIINASTTYSVRVTAAVPTGAASGNLVVDLYSPKFGTAQGTFSIPLASIDSAMLIFTGTLLTTTLAPVPNDLLLRVWAQNIPTGVQIQIDRVEVYPTEVPNLDGQIIGTYQEAFEQFDRLSGVILGTQQNQQPIKSAFVLFGTLYLVKTGSIIAVNDNDTTEPANWTQPRTISQSVGTSGPYGATLGIDNPNAGEEWSLIAGRAGLFLFMGQQPIKLSEEIQQLWNLINWKYGYTIWVENDIVTRRILVGVPMRTFTMNGTTIVQNPWIPEGILTADGNPTTPNCILMVNYRQLNTGSDLASAVEIHRSYSGKLIASDIVRKWSVWSIKSPCGALLTQADTTTPIFLGNSDNNGKIFNLIDGQMEDDGIAIDQRYVTGGFVPSETGQGIQIGVTRFTFEYGTMIVGGSGALAMTVYPNSLDTPYAHALLPNLVLPTSSNGDVEFPINECGSRMFMEFSSDVVGAGFQLSRLVVMMTKDPWSPTRGVNT